MSPADPGALLLLINGVDPARREEYEAWHGQEHVPERLTLPGFLAADRYVFPHDPCRFATIYWLDDAGALLTPEYLHLMAHPSPWSARMRPAMRDVTRWPGAIRERRGPDFAQTLAILSAPDAPDAAMLPPLPANGTGRVLAEHVEAPAHPNWPAPPASPSTPRWRAFLCAPQRWPLPVDAKASVQPPLHLALIARLVRRAA